MNTHANQTQGNKNQSAANELFQQQEQESTLEFTNERAEAISQRKLQDIANNNPRMNQLKAIQQMVDNRFQAKATSAQKNQNRWSSGFEQFNQSDISTLQAQFSLRGHIQRKRLNAIHQSLHLSQHKQPGQYALASAQLKMALQRASGTFLIDDDQSPESGQITKSQFLQTIQGSIKAIAKEIMEPLGLAQNDCPDLAYWLDYYSAKDPDYIEQAMSRYAPGATEAGDWQGFADVIIQRVKNGLAAHVKNGISVDPEPVPSAIEEARPNRGNYIVQRTVDPVQFNCFNNKSTDKPETGNKEEEKKDDEKVEMEEKQARNIKENAEQLRALYQEERYDDIAVLLQANETVGILKKMSAGDYLKYLKACSTTSAAIDQYVIGKDLGNEQSPSQVLAIEKIESDDNKDGEWVFTADFNDLLAQDSFYHLISNNAAHHFNIVSISGSYDIYESDANPGPDNELFLLTKGATQSGASLSKEALLERFIAILVRCKYRLDASKGASIGYVKINLDE